MRSIFFSVLATFVMMSACSEKKSKSHSTRSDNSSESDSDNDEAREEQEGEYEIHGILDPEMNNTVAFAMKTPRGWQVHQSFTREWNGPVPINIIYVALTSPDGQSMIEYLPSTAYSYSDGPTVNSLREQTDSYGEQFQNNAGELAPMRPLEYIKKFLMPQLAQFGLEMEVTKEKSFAPKEEQDNTTKTSAYLDGVMENGRKVRISCEVALQSTNMNGDIFYNWSVLPTVTQSSADIDECYAFTKDGQKSIVINPTWLKKHQELVSKGSNTNRRINERMRDEQRDYQDNLVRNRNEVSAMRGESQRRLTEARKDALGGERSYDDPSTGERKKLDDSYNYVYKDREGTYYFTNSPVSANEVDWVELKRVELKNY